MSIEKDSKWVKDGEVVEVVNENSVLTVPNCVWFKDEKQVKHILTKHDFLEQYKPYEPVYEYRYVTDIYCETKILNRYFTEDEIKEEYEVYQRIDFTKRERK